MWAHSGKLEDRSDWEALPDHLRQVRRLAGMLGKPLGLERSTAAAGELHDLGKFHPLFQQRLAGKEIRVDHSTAGAAVLMGEAAGLGRTERLVAETIAYTILGHHAGLPDMASDADSCARNRIENFEDGLAPEWRDAVTPNLTGIPAEIFAKVRQTDVARRAFDLSLAVRMVFSCLVDADFKATERFYARSTDIRPTATGPPCSRIWTHIWRH